MRIPSILAVILLAVAGTCGVAAQTARHALVIGNGGYKEAPLVNAVNDARAVAEALRGSGFQVTLRENLDHRAMVSAMRQFGDRLRGGGVGLFYFAGHGMQIKGRNFLIPVGTTIEREDEVAYSALDAQAILDKMEVAGNGTNIMILDACRNNPFARSFRGSSAGLAQMDAPVGTLVAFATAPGSVASDGSGVNGLYTQHLLSAMTRPGSKVEDVFKQVRANVRRDSQGRQVPWESTSLEGDFYFRPAAYVQPGSAGAAPQAELDQAMWSMVKDSSLPLELRAYLGRFPQGQYAAQARARLNQLEGQNGGAGLQPVPAAPRPPPTQAAIAPAQAPRIKPARNSAGFTVGDRWRYQVVDKYRGDVIDNWTYKVDRILPNGDMAWNGSAITTSALGDRRRDENKAWPQRVYSGEDKQVPDEMRVGHRQDVRFTVKATRADGSAFEETYSGSLLVKGREKVKVPGGEFDAYRIERDTTFQGALTNGNSRWFGRNVLVGWYVPELRNFVAKESEHRVGSQPPTRTRIELTSYEVAGFQSAQR